MNEENETKYLSPIEMIDQILIACEDCERKNGVGAKFCLSKKRTLRMYGYILVIHQNLSKNSKEYQVVLK
jgi:hypothetical protein